MMFQIIILILMAVFYVCYFVKMFSQMKKGIRTDQLGKGKVGFVRFIEVALKTATYVMPVLQVVGLLTYQGTAPQAMRWVGVTLTGLGVGVFILSVFQMKDSWRAGVSKGEKTELVTSGIYSISRNPAFIGFDLMYIGICCTFFSVWLLTTTTFVILLFHLQIVNVEEVFLIETFGEEYLTYKKKVCRYLGRK